ncbi:hypothetical protein Mapa_001923 [Marchantia paleacea]|nr:hypothetical protein Mapa_001923 [Marchantia paleacea]
MSRCVLFFSFRCVLQGFCSPIGSVRHHFHLPLIGSRGIEHYEEDGENVTRRRSTFSGTMTGALKTFLQKRSAAGGHCIRFCGHHLAIGSGWH